MNDRSVDYTGILTVCCSRKGDIGCVIVKPTVVFIETKSGISFYCKQVLIN